jgi:beta-galactosidase
MRRPGAAGGSWLFVLNHTSEPAVLAAGGQELLSGTFVQGELEVAPGAAAVLRESR